eukprot:3737569-Pyramimonas_sp.AAC.1
MRSEFIVRNGDSMDTATDIALASRCDDIAQQLNELKEAQKAADTLICGLASTPTPRLPTSPSPPQDRRRRSAADA